MTILQNERGWKMPKMYNFSLNVAQERYENWTKIVQRGYLATTPKQTKEKSVHMAEKPKNKSYKILELIEENILCFIYKVQINNGKKTALMW